jgi:hypothetical protein
MLLAMTNVMIDNTIALYNFLAQLRDLLPTRAGPMQAGGAQQRDVIVGHVSAIEFAQDRRDDNVIGAGARRIGEDNADAALWRGQNGEWRSSDRV